MPSDRRGVVVIHHQPDAAPAQVGELRGELGPDHRHDGVREEIRSAATDFARLRQESKASSVARSPGNHGLRIQQRPDLHARERDPLRVDPDSATLATGSPRWASPDRSPRRVLPALPPATSPRLVRSEGPAVLPDRDRADQLRSRRRCRTSRPRVTGRSTPISSAVDVEHPHPPDEVRAPSRGATGPSRRGPGERSRIRSRRRARGSAGGDCRQSCVLLRGCRHAGRSLSRVRRSRSEIRCPRWGHPGDGRSAPVVNGCPTGDFTARCHRPETGALRASVIGIAPAEEV